MSLCISSLIHLYVDGYIWIDLSQQRWLYVDSYNSKGMYAC